MTALMMDRSDRAVLVIDDEPVVLRGLQRGFAREGWQAHIATNGEEGLKVAAIARPSLAVVDLRLGDEWGGDLISPMRELGVDVYVVSGFATVEIAVEAVKLGAKHVNVKPVLATDIVALAENRSATRRSTPSLARAQADYIRAVRYASGGNVSEAARRLGIHRQGLQRLLRKHTPSR